MGTAGLGIHSVIVPTVWFKNEPLTHDQPQIADMPVITTNQGGMAQLMHNGINGLHFKLNDDRDFGRMLLQVIESHDLLDAMQSNQPLVLGIEAQSLLVIQLYLQTVTAESGLV